jgi:hypothetical protein
MCVRLSHSTLLLLSLRRVQPVASALDVWLLHMLATKQSERRQSWKREISRRLRDKVRFTRDTTALKINATFVFLDLPLEHNDAQWIGYVR